MGGGGGWVEGWWGGGELGCVRPVVLRVCVECDSRHVYPQNLFGVIGRAKTCDQK